MTKPLSELIEASKARRCVGNYDYVDGVSYDRMKRVAIELAKACEFYIPRHDSQCDILFAEAPLECSCGLPMVSANAINRAKEIIGEVK